jgi:hypothetical protein
MKQFANFVFVLLVAGFVGCGKNPDLSPISVSLDDPRVVPLLKATEQVDRAALGFTPISKTANIRLEGAGRGYDAMLHIYGETERTISFLKTSDGYKCFAEQELYTGPKRYTDHEGTWNEKLVIQYQIEPINGIITNQTYISYMGEDKRLAGHQNMTLDYIAPILKEWQQK